MGYGERVLQQAVADDQSAMIGSSYALVEVTAGDWHEVRKTILVENIPRRLPDFKGGAILESCNPPRFCGRRARLGDIARSHNSAHPLNAPDWIKNTLVTNRMGFRQEPDARVGRLSCSGDGLSPPEPSGTEIPADAVVRFLRGHSGKERRSWNIAELSLNLLLCAPCKNLDLAQAGCRDLQKFLEGNFLISSIYLYRGSGPPETAQAVWIEWARHLAARPKLT